ncbi:MAG TPA: hypothetical protein DDW27_00700, partial [Bacteroidales bacterium]|nr:hypothetical protein [Bacteroidales bacterium]
MKKKTVNSARMPIYRDSGFELYDAETTEQAYRGETDPHRVPDYYLYSRYRNPTVEAAEEEIQRMEGTKWALLVQSGMAAIDIALSLFQSAEDKSPWLFFSEIYGGTISFADEILKKRRGIDIRGFNPDNEIYDLSKFESVIKDLRPALVYVEIISNPLLVVPDAKGIFNIAKKYGAKIVVDNTFATPYLFKPADHGADIVIHSATKYFSGHGNLTAGAVCGNDTRLMKSAVQYRRYTGHMLSADDAYRLSTQIMTFHLRFRQQCANASKIAELLKKSEVIGKVWFPGLKDHPSHNEAKNLFRERGFGGMVTFDFAGKTNAEKKLRRDKFIKVVSDKIKVIPTLGDPRTILMPVESVWGEKYPEPGMLRMS